jgi:hypothetical protein
MGRGSALKFSENLPRKGEIGAKIVTIGPIFGPGSQVGADEKVQFYVKMCTINFGKWCEMHIFVIFGRFLPILGKIGANRDDRRSWAEGRHH